MVSTRIAVLPVVRSPMISSRWPRPIGIIESIAFRPVCSGSFTGWRSTTPGALNSSGRVSLLHVLPVAEQRGADIVLFEVERDPGDAVLELEHLHRGGALEAVDAGDAVADLEHGADLGEVGLDLELLDPL